MRDHKPNCASENISIITPAFNEEQNIPLLYDRLLSLSNLPSWEWIIVDDHSTDGTFDVIGQIARRDARVKGIRLARNSGAHTALLCGLHNAGGNCVVDLDADLQDPPELIGQLVEKWRTGAQIVWAVRESRRGEKASTLLFSRLFRWLMRHVVGLAELPAGGFDTFLLDRTVVDVLKQFGESQMSINAMISWIGFRQHSISYDRQARAHGRSGWSFGKKVKLFIDSITGFTYLPIRLMSGAGSLVALSGFVGAGFLVYNALHSHPTPGWSSLMVVVLVIGGMQMLMMGILGEYLWRSLAESRRRPRFLIEETTEKGSGVERPSEGENPHDKP